MQLLPKQISITIKMAIVIILLICFGMGSLGLLMVSNQGEVMRVQLHDFGATLTRQLASIATEPILSEDALALDLIARNMSGGEKVLGAAIHSDTGAQLAGSGIQPAPEVFRRLMTDELSVDDWILTQDLERSQKLITFAVPARYRELTAGYAVVTLSASLMEETLARARQSIIIGTLVLSMIASLAAVYLSRRMSRPIRALAEATEAIRNGHFPFQVQERRNDEIGILIDNLNRMVAGLSHKAQVEQVLSRYVSPQVAESVLANLDQVKLDGRQVSATVLFADIVGFTSMAEGQKPSETSALLNEFFTYISVASGMYRGIIDKFIGDCVMVVFGAFDDDADHAFHAVASAVLIQKIVYRVNARRKRHGLPAVKFRMGINRGHMFAGNLGSDDRMEYTVVGDAVNLASRLSSLATGGQIVVQDELFHDPALCNRIIGEPHEKTIKIRGKSKPVTTFNICDVDSSQRPIIAAQVKRILAARAHHDAA